MCYPDYLELVASDCAHSCARKCALNLSLRMELFLNLCWLSLLLPAYFLWRQKSASAASSRDKAMAGHPLVFLCALGCAVTLLFPVISATDDLHAMRPEMEESESAFRSANRCGGAPLAQTHSAQAILPGLTDLLSELQQVGTVLPFERGPLGLFTSPAPSGRAPTASPLTSL